MRSLVKHGRDTLKPKAAEKIKLDDQKDRDLINRVFETNFEDIPGDPGVLYHKKCYDRIVNYRIPKGAKSTLTKDEHPSTHLDRTTEVAATKLSRPGTRGSLIPRDKSLCIFCQKESSRETVLIMTIPVSEKILDASKHDYIMCVRTAGISDLIAADAIYHNQCRVQFERRLIRCLIENRDVPFPKSWAQFISSSEIKANLATFLSNELMSPDVHGDREIVTVGGFSDIDKAASTRGRDIDSLKADHEEADTRIILHAKEASDTGYERLVML